MVKNIVFDIGNVVAYIDLMEVVKKTTDDENIQKFLIDNLINSPEWSGFGLIDTGYLNWEEIIDIIGDRTNHIYDEYIRKFAYEHYEYLKVNNNVISLINKLKNNNYKVYLLSNINDYAHNILKPSGIFELVDGYVLSYLEHQIKPHQTIYKTLIERFNVNPNESIFIDDRLDNCETAKSLGFDYINVLPNNYEDLENELKEKGII